MLAAKLLQGRIQLSQLLSLATHGTISAGSYLLQLLSEWLPQMRNQPSFSPARPQGPFGVMSLVLTPAPSFTAGTMAGQSS